MSDQLMKIPPAEALRFWNEGKSLREIASLFPGASYMAASRAVRRAVARGLGVAISHEESARERMSRGGANRVRKIDPALALQMREQGKTHREIEAHFGVKRNSVNVALWRARKRMAETP